MSRETLSDLDPEMLTKLESCEERLGYNFSDKKLLREALTHASGALHRWFRTSDWSFLATLFWGPWFATFFFISILIILRAI